MKQEIFFKQLNDILLDFNQIVFISDLFLMSYFKIVLNIGVHWEHIWHFMISNISEKNIFFINIPAENLQILLQAWETPFIKYSKFTETFGTETQYWFREASVKIAVSKYWW